jgi:hypothetical protein
MFEMFRNAKYNSSGQILVEKWWLGTPDYDVDGVCHLDDNVYLVPEEKFT